jgi:hypothetical protein
MATFKSIAYMWNMVVVIILCLQNGALVHEKTGMCLDVDGIASGDDIYLRPCVDKKATQQWNFGKYF